MSSGVILVCVNLASFMTQEYFLKTVLNHVINRKREKMVRGWELVSYH